MKQQHQSHMKWQPHKSKSDMRMLDNGFLSSSTSNSTNPNVAQFIAELGFSSLDHEQNGNQPASKKQHDSSLKERNMTLPRTLPSRIGVFGQKLDFPKVSSFQQLTDENGLSWWYDTTDDDSDESSQV